MTKHRKMTSPKFKVKTDILKTKKIQTINKYYNSISIKKHSLILLRTTTGASTQIK